MKKEIKKDIINSQLISYGPWKVRRKHTSIIWNNFIYLFGGFNGESSGNHFNDVWKFDYINNIWILVCKNSRWTGRDGHSTVIFENSCYILGGTDDPYFCRNDIWKSEDGSTWNKIKSSTLWSPRWQHASIVHNNTIFVVGGWGDQFFNDVWSSQNAIDWELICSDAPWNGRMNHSLVSFQDQIVLIGGSCGKKYFNDIWISSDGINWTQICAKAPWRGRQGQDVTIIQDVLFLCGGYDGNYQLNDIWYTWDCVSWYKFDTKFSFPPRQGHSLVGYENKLYVIGGFSDGNFLNDTYCIVLPPKLPYHDHALCYRSNKIKLKSTGLKSSRSNTNILSLANYLSINHIILSTKELILYRSEKFLLQQEFLFLVGIIMSSLNHSYSDNYTHFENYHNNNNNNINSNINSNVNNINNLIEERLSEFSYDSTDSSVSFGQQSTDLNSFLDNQNITLFTLLSNCCDQSVTSRIITGNNNNNSKIFLQNNLEDNYIDSIMTSVEDLLYENNTNKLKNELFLPKDSLLSSTSLSNLFRNYQHSIRQLQQEIFQLAENNNSTEEQLTILLLQRDNIAMEAFNSAFKLKGYIDKTYSILQYWLTHISIILQYIERLENYLKLYNIQKDTLSHYNSQSQSQLQLQELSNIQEIQDIKDIGYKVQELNNQQQNQQQTSINIEKNQNINIKFDNSLWDEWKNDVNEFNQYIDNVTIPSSMNEIDKLIENLNLMQEYTDIIEAFKKSTDLIEVQSLTSVLDFHLNESFQMRKENFHQLIESIFLKHLNFTIVEENITEIQQRNQVVTSIQSELIALGVYRSSLIQKLETICNKGYIFLNSFYNKIKFHEINISELQNELYKWILLLEKLSSQKVQLKDYCQQLIKENEINENKLIELENIKIDKKSELEKMSLKLKRLKITRSVVFSQTTLLSLESLLTNNNNSNSNNNSNLLSTENLNKIEENLIKQVIEADTNVSKFRRVMRDWYRNVKSFASTTAPELYFYLPILLSPCSLLSDDSFAEYGRLLKRQLTDYSNFNQMGTISNSTKHLLIKANYKDTEVILKGFNMLQPIQRSCFEREVRILGMLNSEFIISPIAIIDEINISQNKDDIKFQSLNLNQYNGLIFLEYPYYITGNLKNWRLSSERSPWQIQSVIRQLFYGLMYLHDHNIIHMNIRPSNILIHSDGRVVISDFESACIMNEINEDQSFQIKNLVDDSYLYVSPEIQSGSKATFSSDMFSTGVVLYFLHFPQQMSKIIPGQLVLPSSCDPDLSELIQLLLEVEVKLRPSAASCLNHSYVRSTFVDQMVLEGELVEQSKKIHAVRNLLTKIRKENRNNLLKITVKRESIVSEIFNVFEFVPISKMKSLLRIIFEGESGVDEGGMLIELFTLFFERILNGEENYFQGSTSSSFSSISPSSSQQSFNNNNSHNNNHNNNGNTQYVLPIPTTCEKRLLHYEIFGSLLVKALYCNCRISNRLCPVVFKYLTNTPVNMRDLKLYDPILAKSLQWMLATKHVENFQLDFTEYQFISINNNTNNNNSSNNNNNISNNKEFDSNELITDQNKHQFITSIINNVLIKRQQKELDSIKKGFISCLKELSLEALPFLTLLSHNDWRVLLCGDIIINSSKIIQLLSFSGFKRKSRTVTWLKEIITEFDEILLKKLLIFITGSPILPPGADLDIETEVLENRFIIQVRKLSYYYSNPNNVLPIAHTCFNQLDIPEYTDKDMFKAKLLYAIENSQTFDML